MTLDLFLAVLAPIGCICTAIGTVIAVLSYLKNKKS